jgi:NACalpha-BTF3-like transcription factor
MREVKKSQIIKDSKKKVEKVIDSILKELGMKRKEFDEVKRIAMEMKASGQSKILTPTPIVVVGPTEEVIVRKHLLCHM